LRWFDWQWGLLLRSVSFFPRIPADIELILAVTGLNPSADVLDVSVLVAEKLENDEHV
jgi:hypothetical protein